MRSSSNAASRPGPAACAPTEPAHSVRHYLLASDFDQTLSFNDSGILLSEMLGISGFAERCAGLSSMHLVQQGAELAYLLLHDPEYRRVRSGDLAEVGRCIRLKQASRSCLAFWMPFRDLASPSAWSPQHRKR